MNIALRVAQAESLEFSELENHELASTLDDLEGEVQAAVDWMDDAFGDIEAEVSRLAPVRAIRSALQVLLGR